MSDIELLKDQQAKTIAGLARFVANFRDNPEAAEHELRTWVAAVDPTVDFAALKVPKAPSR